jgi:hypothetical protein
MIRCPNDPSPRPALLGGAFLRLLSSPGPDGPGLFLSPTRIGDQFLGWALSLAAVGFGAADRVRPVPWVGVEPQNLSGSGLMLRAALKFSGRVVNRKSCPRRGRWLQIATKRETSFLGGRRASAGEAGQKSVFYIQPTAGCKTFFRGCQGGSQCSRKKATKQKSRNIYCVDIKGKICNVPMFRVFGT